MRLSGAKALLEALKREGVEMMFGIPGGATIPFYDELYHEESIRHILARHEQCAAHMADGYARVSGRVGVCCATSGPGATNLVTGIATAYMDSSPVVAIVGQVPRSMIGKDAFQEADVVGIMTPISKYAYQVMNAAEIPEIVKAAFMIASTNRPGPVVLEFPRDVLTEEVDIDFPSQITLRGYTIRSGDPHPYQLKRVLGLVLNAEKPIIIAGGGVIMANASEELIKFAELIQAPVVTTLMGKGAIPEIHPLCLGIMGMHGRAEANHAVEEADLIIAVGVRFADRTIMRLDLFAQDAKVIHIDLDPAEIGKNVRADVPIVADAKKALKALYDRLVEIGVKKHVDSPWLKRVRELQKIFASEHQKMMDGPRIRPAKLMKILREMLPEDSIITTGVGQNQMWAALYFKALKPRTFITSGGLGTMGFGLPAAIGAKAAAPNRVVVNIDGDGSFLMTQQDLATSITEELPVISIILDNRSLGMVRQWQCLLCENRTCEVDLGNVPDFVKLAEAYGAVGVRVESYEEFESAVRKALFSEVSVVIDVPISPDEKVFPMVLPGKRLKEVVYGG